MAADAFLVVLFSIACYVHLKAFLEEGRVSSLLFSADQAVLVVIYLVRRRSFVTSTRVQDWVVATGGGWLVYAVRPVGEASGPAATAGEMVQCFGLAFTIIGFCYLGRSFGIVAANRGLKVNGPYRLVRHPLYAAHAVTLAGFVVANFSWFNLAILMVVQGFQLLRIEAEERVLRDSSDYASYRSRVRWRLLPGLY